MKQSISYAVLSLALLASAELSASQKVDTRPVSSSSSSSSSVASPVKPQVVLISEQRQQGVDTFKNAFIAIAREVYPDCLTALTDSDIRDILNELQNNIDYFQAVADYYARLSSAAISSKHANSSWGAKLQSYVSGTSVLLNETQRAACVEKAYADINKPKFTQFTASVLASDKKVDVLGAFIGAMDQVAVKAQVPALTNNKNSWKRFVGIRSGAAVAALAVATIVLFKTGVYKKLPFATKRV